MQHLHVQYILETLRVDWNSQRHSLNLPVESFNKEDRGSLCLRGYFGIVMAGSWLPSWVTHLSDWILLCPYVTDYILVSPRHLWGLTLLPCHGGCLLSIQMGHETTTMQFASATAPPLSLYSPPWLESGDSRVHPPAAKGEGQHLEEHMGEKEQYT